MKFIAMPQRQLRSSSVFWMDKSGVKTVVENKLRGGVICFLTSHSAQVVGH